MRDDARMEKPLDPRVEIGHVRLAVGALERSVAFYQQALGFDVTGRDGDGTVFLGAGGRHYHLALTAAADGVRQQRLALRYPDRTALAGAFRRIEAAGVAIDRSSSVDGSDALYVRDPDGHEVELYCDRPPASAGHIGAGTAGALDLPALRSEALVVPAAPGAAPPVLTDTDRQRLRDLRTRLLQLHKVLLDDTRGTYEMDRGRVGSNANFLQLVIGDPWFAWLHSLSEMVVRIDEAVEPGSPATQAEAAVLVEQVERLLTPAESGEGFARRYYDALQRQPAVVMAHADVRRTLKSMR